jgi:hypothetical protein
MNRLKGLETAEKLCNVVRAWEKISNIISILWLLKDISSVTYFIWRGMEELLLEIGKY